MAQVSVPSRAIAVATIVFALVFSAAFTCAQSPAPTTDRGRILLVLPFDNRTSQPNLEWIREAAAELLSSRFASAGFSPMTRADRVYALDHLGLPPGFQPSRASSLKLAQTLDADSIIVGSYSLDGANIVAAEVIFHGSQNTQVYPFSGRREWAQPDTTRDLELVQVGHRIYNSWLADFISVAPDRLIGLSYLPMWDVDLAVKELTFAAEHGLRGVNFPAPREGIAEYDHPRWEPLWSACEEYKMNLATHAGLPGHTVFGPQKMAMTRIEVAGWPCRRGMVRMIFGGVFERHPNLKLILTELSRGWWETTKREFDFVYSSPSEALHDQAPKRPSEYMESNVFIGASFMPPSEVREAIEDGFADHVIWGRDYPHGEGTYKYPEIEGEESQTKHYLRWAFAGCPLDVATDMLSNTGIHAYDLNREALEQVAAQIGPTVDEVTAPWDHVPAEWANNLVDVQTGEVAEGFVAIRER